jgi:argininosuccinate lyase
MTGKPAKPRTVTPAEAKARARSTVKPWEHAKSGGSEADPVAARFVESLSYDTRLYAVDIEGSIAHARMLHHVGLLAGNELAAIEQGLREIRAEIESSPDGPTAVGTPGAWPGWRTDLEDVHMCIEAALIERIGDAGRKLHTGRSRNDQVALDLRLWLREAAAEVARRLGECQASLAALSAAQGSIVMPAYTHMQRAQPIRLSAELLAWHEMLGSDRREMERLAERGRQDCPLGAGAVAGSSLPLDRAYAAGLLGFETVAASSIEATASRDDALDYVYALARTAMHLSRWAEQWIIYCTAEFSFLSLAAAHTTGSSMMPQKRNPDMLELIRGRCGGVYGHLVALLTICKGLPIGYNRDLQEDKRHVFAAHDCVADCLSMAARIIAGARFNEAAVAPTLARGHLDATSLAEHLVTRGAPFRTAHQVVAALVRRCEESGRALGDLTVEAINAALDEAGLARVRVGDEVYGALGATNVVERYRTAGHGGSGIAPPTGGRSPAPERADEGGATPRTQGRAPTRSTRRAGDLSAALPARSAGAEAAESGAAAPAALFAGGEDGDTPDARLIRAYADAGRTLDDLPYTPEFDRIHEAMRPHGAPTKRVVFHRLHNLRKAGRLPRVGRTETSPVKITEEEERTLRAMVIDAVGTLGQRDRLPFTDAFDRLVESFNASTGRALGPHAVWRLVAKLAK